MHMYTSSRFDNTVVQYIKYRHWNDTSRAKQGMTECERQKDMMIFREGTKTNLIET